MGPGCEPDDHHDEPDNIDTKRHEKLASLSRIGAITRPGLIFLGFGWLAALARLVAGLSPAFPGRRGHNVGCPPTRRAPRSHRARVAPPTRALCRARYRPRRHLGEPENPRRRATPEPRPVTATEPRRPPRALPTFQD